jgi:hypothetical protein
MIPTATGIPASTTILKQLSGTTGGVGTYQMSAAATQTVSTAEAITATGFLTNCWAFRNSCSGAIFAMASDINPGPYAAEANAIQWSNGNYPGLSPAGVVYSLSSSSTTQVGPPYPSNVSDTTTGCEAATGVFDASWNLTGTYLTDYLYTCGAQIG